MSTAIRERLSKVLESIEEAAEKRGITPEKITLVAVSKKQSLDLMKRYESVCEEMGRKAIFGENYVQEFAAKRPYLSPSSRCHLIGTLQSNKVKKAIGLFDLIESVHSVNLLKMIDKEACKAGKTQDIYLQINISRDPGKSGFLEEEVRDAWKIGLGLSGVKLKGIMAITRYYEKREDVRKDFARMREILDNLSGDQTLDLSMGMSRDYDIAIEEGATVVRIGTAIFGPRRQ
ncbi:MAG: YggS family pyridoxal phosphate-dependent enzyme [Candidatus Dadabacteria bacterium]|nr:MAG: YggS family pyridoxal phosphate-dependent enzyme [Candidatus Dadabacteria bacterium]